jgi:hypothetical protein
MVRFGQKLLKLEIPQQAGTISFKPTLPYRSASAFFARDEFFDSQAFAGRKINPNSFQTKTRTFVL